MAKHKDVSTLLTDASVPLPVRARILRTLCRQDEKDADQLLVQVLEAAANGRAEQHFVAKTRELAELLQHLEEGPLRCATFDCMAAPGSERLGRRARVILPDGGSAYCSVPDEALAGALRCGDTVWLDAQGRALLFRDAAPPSLGEEGRLERRLPGGDVEVSVGEIGRFVCRPSARLVEQMEAGEAEPGCTLVVCQRRVLAFLALPPEEGPNHLRYLSRDPVPDVVVERDVGAPPPFIEEIAAHVRREIGDPALGRRYGLRRSRLLLATGVAGSGKTLAIHALWRRLYEEMEEATGVAIPELPPRVLKLRASEVLSKWLGSSDRHLDRFFDEVQKTARDTFPTPDGRVVELPVLVICEEIDALARQRGEDAIHDRIQTTLLQRLDPSQDLFRDRVVIVICTSNVPSLLDVAFVRRAGGQVAPFGRMDRFGFQAVLDKHLRDRPLRDGEDLRGVIADLTTWLFAPNAGDTGLVELTYVGQPSPVVKRRRDFLTGALVDRAVQQASQVACDAEWRGEPQSGLSVESLMRALDAQVRSIVDQLSPGNCEHYLTLPDAVRVGTVRRLETPAVLPIELARAS